jgi:hypothetical protein
MKKISTVLCFSFAVAVLFAWAPGAEATSTLYSNNCSSCHGSTPDTCAGCHGHGVHSSSAKTDIKLTGTTNKTEYSPGETVSVVINGGYRSGWVRAILYDNNMTERARSTGPTGEGGGASFPITLTAPAPTAAGTYTWNVSWYGNQYDKSGAFFGSRWTPDPNNPDHGEEIVSTNSFTVLSVNRPASVGVYRGNGNWYINANGSQAWDEGDVVFKFGIEGDVPVTGDWDGNGNADAAVFRENGYWYRDLNANGIWDAGVDAVTKLGIAGDVPVTGDWNGDGKTEIGVFRTGAWFLDYNGNGVWDGGTVDRKVTFGNSGDIPVTGDWNGDGVSDVGVFRGNGYWHLDVNGNRSLDAGDISFKFGVLGDIPVTGDWNDDKITDVGAFRGNGDWYLDANGSRKSDAEDAVFKFGVSGDVPVTGKW